MLSSKPAKKKTTSPIIRWLNRAVAAIALVNLGLIAFDLSYIPFRDQYLRFLPEFTDWYGEQFKGIEPNPDTESYIQAVDDFVNSGGLSAGDADQRLEDLRQRSVDMINQDPFAIANKSGTLERIKRRVQEEVGEANATQAFEQFWSRDYIEQEGTAGAIAFFNERVRPLMATNYYRGIGENGQPVDEFWRIDNWFIALFAADFIIRTIHLSRRYNGVNWFDAMIWRWYDIFLLLPFWRWLRVIPTVLRVNQSRLIDLEPVRDRLIHGVIASVSIEMTEIVVLRVVEQLQQLVRDGSAVEWLLYPEKRRRYVDITGVDEAAEISKEVTHLLVYQMLPQVKPEIEALAKHSVESMLQQSPAYRGLVQIPGLGALPHRINDRVISDATDNVYQSLVSSLEDDEGKALSQALVARMGEVIRRELINDGTLQTLETLIIDLLEELKHNYVEQLGEKDFDDIEYETHHLYEMTQGNRPGRPALGPKQSP